MLFSLLLLFLLTRLVVFAQSTERSAPCTALAAGWDLIDDSPTINAAISECGNGGRIVLPAAQIYSVRSPINLAPCRNCDIQIEGTLLVSQYEWAYWGTQDSIFKTNDVHGVTIRSVTGEGVIDGNALNYYLRSRWQGYNAAPHLLHATNGSSDIHIDNLRIKNAPMHFFRLDGNSSNLKFTRLNMTVEGQDTLAPPNEVESYGFELGDVSDVTIDNVYMHFRPRSNNGIYSNIVGACVVMDSGTRRIFVKDMFCKGTWGGVIVMIGSMSAAVGPPGYNLTTTLTGTGVSDVLVQNLTVESTLGTGYRLAITDQKISNVTWDGVNVLSGTAIDGERCYQRSHSTTIWWMYCVQAGWKAAFENIRFKNFRGPTVGKAPAPGWGCAANQTLCDIKFEGWPEL